MNIIFTKTKKFFLFFLLFLFSFFVYTSDGQAAGDSRIRFSWQPNVDDTVKYRLYHGVVPGLYGESFEVATSTVIFDSSSFISCKHYFVVAAVDASGNESNYSNRIDIDRCVSGCGNGLVESWLDVPEICDPKGDTGMACETSSGYPGNRECKTDCSGYEDACTTNKVCGDNSVDGPETCDGGDNTEVDCVLGLYKGVASCSYSCQLGSCLIGNKRCGNGITEDAEDCDSITGQETKACTISGFNGTQTCGTSTGCLWSTCQKKPECGDRVQDSGEDCDGSAFKNSNSTCQYWTGDQTMNGRVRCGSDCKADTTNCVKCGDGIMEANETCEAGGIYKDGQSSCESLSGQNWFGTVTCNPSTCQRVANCFEKIVGSCGTNTGQRLPALTASNINNCSAGTVSNFRAVTSPSPGWTWICLGSNGGGNSEECRADQYFAGACGDAVNRVFYNTPPADGFCNVSSYKLNDVKYNTFTFVYDWICKGNNNGTEKVCQAAKCGDGVKKGVETCDDGSANGSVCTPQVYNFGCAYCDSACQSQVVPPAEKCGDAIIQTAQGEVCDDGNNTGEYGGACMTDCKSVPPKCGDNTINGSTGQEQCDCGDKNGTGAMGCGAGLGVIESCSSDCKKITPDPRCGDGVVNQASEKCDCGSQNGTGAKACGGLGANESCSSSCQTESTPPNCGDSQKNQTSEECDCGLNNGKNIANCGPGSDATYACSSACKKVLYSSKRCGDGLVNQTSEKCDCGDSAVTSIPSEPECGMGTRRNGMQGTPGYGEKSPYCDNCSLKEIIGPSCGDNITQTNYNEACDNGPSSSDRIETCKYSSTVDGTATCNSSCSRYGNCERPPFCGDGSKNQDIEECDNGTANTNNGCTIPAGQASCTYCTTNCKNATSSAGSCGAMEAGKACGDVSTSSASSASQSACLASCQSKAGIACCQFTGGRYGGTCYFIYSRNNSDAFLISSSGHSAALCTPSTPVCGNGIIEKGESCDGAIGGYPGGTCKECKYIDSWGTFKIAPVPTSGSTATQSCLSASQLQWFCPGRECMAKGIGTPYGKGSIVYEGQYEYSCPEGTYGQTVCKINTDTWGTKATVVCRDGIRWTDNCLLNDGSWNLGTCSKMP